MSNIKVGIQHTLPILTGEELFGQQQKMDIIFSNLINRKGLGNDFLGWLDLPVEISEALIDDILNTTGKIGLIAEVVVIVGIGGSYLGARAVIEALKHSFSDHIPSKHPQIVYAGHNISEDYMWELLEFLKDKKFAVVVISKSGTTTEPAIAFRLLKIMLEERYGMNKASDYIFAITDKMKGALKQISNTGGYQTYSIPDDVGGRYSVLTAVGLLPIAIAGYDIKQLLEGAKQMRDQLMSSSDMKNNPAVLYAVTRNMLYQKGKTSEIMVSFNPKLAYFAEWWKQLYGESEGKDNKGILPVSVNFTTDLHSLGQYIQDGLRNLFETVLSVDMPEKELRIPKTENDPDEINYIADMRLSEVNRMAELGTINAHVDGRVPIIIINVPHINENILGQLIYFFEFACALSGYMLGVNPFDQPGVEAYKKNMFKLLGKSGYTI